MDRNIQAAPKREMNSFNPKTIVPPAAAKTQGLHIR
jgi:hypothetical protein